MKILNIILICALFTACYSNNSTSPTVTKIEGMTKVDTTTHLHFINEFYLISPSPNSLDELKSIMKGVSSSNSHDKYDIERFIFIQDGGDVFSSNYIEDPKQGVAAEDILGRIEYKNINGKRVLTLFDVE